MIKEIRMLNFLIKGLRSLKFTIFLVICLTSIFLLGVIIPQKGLLGRDLYIQWKLRNPGLVSFLEAIKFTDIHVSPITITLWALFFLNLIFIMSKRIPFIWRRCFREDIPANIDSIKDSKQYEIIDGIDIKNIKAILKNKGYRVLDKDNAFRAVKNRFSPLATILFHVSFFLLLLGGVISFYTQFRANVELAVGETFEGQYLWIKKPKIGGIPATNFTVEDIRPTYYKKTVPVNLDVVLKTKRGTEVIGINKPYKEGPLSFVVQGIDIAPLFIIRDSEGNEIDGAFVKLKGLGGREDHFAMKGYEFKTVFYTDYSAGLKGRTDEMADVPQVLKQLPGAFPQAEQPKEIINPAFNIAVLKDGKLLKTETIKKGESIKFDNHSLQFADLTYWAKFYVVKEHGLGIIYTGFALMILALIIRFLFFRRDIKGIIKGDSLHIGGRGEFFVSIFEEEFKQLIDSLKA